jgi:hypothetical protein
MCGLVDAVASVWFAIGLMVVLVLVLAWGTWVCHVYGDPAAQFGIYGTWWFTGLGVLLALNILCALILRLPWRWQQAGFIMAHVGLLVLLLGCLITRWHQVRAVLGVFEGRVAWQAFEDSQHFELTVRSDADAQSDEKKDATPIVVPFSSGPFNWEEYQGLAWFPWRLAARDRGVIYNRDGIRLEVIDYLSNSLGLPVPRVDLRVAGLSSGQSADDSAGVRFPLIVAPAEGPHRNAHPYGMGTYERLPGGQVVAFWMTGDAEETAAFCDSAPAADIPLGKLGQIALYADGQCYHLAVDGWEPGTRRPLGKSGLEVEFVGPIPSVRGIELAIHGESGPARRMRLSADYPLYNEHDRDHKVFGTLWCEAPPQPKDGEAGERVPQNAGRPRIDILQGADQSLYLRAWQAPQQEPVVRLDDPSDVPVFSGTPAALSLSVEQHIASKSPDIRPDPLPFVKGRTASFSRRRAHVVLTVDDTKEDFWLTGSSDDPLETIFVRKNCRPAEVNSMRRVVRGKGRTVTLRLRPDEIDLGMAVYLRKSRQRLEPGTSRASYFSSLIDLLPRAADGKDSLRANSRHPLDATGYEPLNKEPLLVEMNRPLSVTDPQSGRTYFLFQDSFPGPGEDMAPWPARSAVLGPTDDGLDPTEDGRKIYMSNFSLLYDPGRWWKYAGCFLIVVGTFWRYFGKR